MKICQSCTMPISDIADRGTEKDGSPSEEYCKFCYVNGEFTDKGQTLADMEKIVDTEMKKRGLPESLIQQSLAALPYLKRWQRKAVLG